MDESLRCFIALDIPASVRENLARAQECFARSQVRISWIPAGNLHLTLAFLGYTLESALVPLRAGLDQIAAGVAPFQMSVTGAGTFGRPGFPRVVWAGIQGPPPELQRIHVGLKALLQGLEIPQEDRPFAPHITLGRVKSPDKGGALTSALASIKNDPFGDVQVDRLLIMRSHLDEPRVRYSVLHESPLKGT